MHEFITQTLALALRPGIAKRVFWSLLSLMVLIIVWGGIETHRVLRRLPPSIAPSHPLPVLTLPTLSSDMMTVFGRETIPPLEANRVQRSLLHVEVVGVLFSETGSYVIIKVPGEEEQVFQEGETLLPGVVIQRITTDGILILREGVLERLTLPQTSLTFEPPLLGAQ